MATNYGAAAIRHLRDAELLLAVGVENDPLRWANADHLAGFAAECALKVALPAGPDGGVRDGRHRVHIDELWERVPTQGLPRCYSGLVTLLRRPVRPFGDWRAEQRYEEGTAITQAALEGHVAEARRLCGAVGLLGQRRGA